MRQLAFSIGSIILLICFLSGCGTKGRLTLPEATKTASSTKQEGKPVSTTDVNTATGQH